MRITEGAERGSWATYSRLAREGAGLGKSELARRLGMDRGTVHRWEIGKTRPEDPQVVQAFAEVLGLDLEEALAAAGLRPGVAPPAEPTREPDEEIDLVRTDPRLSDDMKRRIIQLIRERRERDRAAALEETRRLIDLFGRS
ncbi:helix-turn-helix domain-containing protein [Micromonospora chersina]|uniref:helix-turn-helix domain-containing protein n=1 Tax=Micromonospora chersina TaxID=47854 RepID=UPI00378F5677